MDFTVYSIRDIESWVSMMGESGFSNDLHFNLRKDPNIPDPEKFANIKGSFAYRKRNSPFQRAMRGKPFDWVYDKAKGKYVWKEEVTKKANTPKGFKYIGPSENQVWKHYQNSASNGISRLYRKYLGAPDIDQQSFVNARNKDLEKLVKEIFDAVKNRLGPNNFASIDLDSRGSGQYYGSHRSRFGIEDGVYEVEMQVEYEGITFKALVLINPLPKGYDNTIYYVDTDEIKNNSRYNRFNFSGKQDKTIVRITIEDKTVFKQIYKELFNEEYKGY